ncbi:MAG: hypothetical protein Q6L60_10020 [Thermostichus sp. HHBFW_bins_43]
MWQALKALWGKIAGQAPPVPSTSTTSARKPVPPNLQQPPRDDLSKRATTPTPQSSPKPTPPAAGGKRPVPSEETPAPAPTVAVPTPESREEATPVSEPAATLTPKVGATHMGGESSPPVVASLSQEKPADSSSGRPQARPIPIFSAQPTPTAESINSFGAKSDIGSRISSIAASTDSGRAVSSISVAKLRQPE